MSRHIVESPDGNRRWVFGWDQGLQSFFLQVHDNTLSEEVNPVVWLGTMAQDRMYEVEDLTRVCSNHGLDLAPSHQRELYAEKDDGA